MSSAPPFDTNELAGDSPEALERLRELLFGTELRELEELRQRLDALGLTPDEVAEQLPQAIAIRTAKDQQLARALGPTMDKAFEEAVQRHPKRISNAIFPIIGPAIRKAIAETMAGLVQTINRAIEHSLSWNGLKWRVEAWRTGVPYGQVVIKHALLYRIEQIFLIDNDTGLLIAHVTADDVDIPDADVVSSMLTAIKDFVQDSFHADSGHGVRRMSVADHLVHAEVGPHAMIGAVIRGVPPENVGEKLQEILERIHLQFGTLLADFDGDPEPLAGTRDILSEGLKTVVMSDLPRARRTSLRITWAAAAAVAIILIIMATGSLRSWSRTLTALRAEPGIVVVHSNYNWLRRSEIRGLADPAARAPHDVVAASGRDTSSLAMTWDPFMSFEPALAANRAHQWLGAPDQISLEVRDGVLIASGAATPEWLSEALTRGRSVPGVQSVNVDAVVWLLPEPLTAAQSRLDTLRIGFAVGSADVTETALNTIRQVATLLADLETDAAQHAVRPHVEMVGRTDTTGTNETNRVLSQRRAEAVLTALERSGVTADMLVARGVGTTEPMVGNDRQSTAALNRTVSFILTYTLRRDQGDARE